jgi:Protein of unknown function (DUF669)
MSDVFDGGLDLTDANPDDVGFPAIPSGSYEARVVSAEWKATENIDGSKALPHDTPYLNVQVAISEDEEPRNGTKVANARVWFKAFVPPPDYDPSKAQRMKNSFANFLDAIGEDWQKKNYKLDAEKLSNDQPELTVIVRKRFNDYQGKDTNEVEGFKPAGSSAKPSSGLLV